MWTFKTHQRLVGVVVVTCIIYSCAAIIIPVIVDSASYESSANKVGQGKRWKRTTNDGVVTKILSTLGPGDSTVEHKGLTSQKEDLPMQQIK